jgi:hypothetical protein
LKTETLLITPQTTVEYPAVIQISSTTDSPNITMSSERKLDKKSIMGLYWQANTSFRRLLNSYKEPSDAPVKLSDSYGRLKVWAETLQLTGAVRSHWIIDFEKRVR